MVGRHAGSAASAWNWPGVSTAPTRRSSWDWHRDNYGTWLTPETGNFLVGVLSEAENKTIADGLNDVIMDHFVDVVDRNGSTEMVLRSGATKAIQPGSWIVNCTGYLHAARLPLRALRVRTAEPCCRSNRVLPHSI